MQRLNDESRNITSVLIPDIAARELVLSCQTGESIDNRKPRMFTTKYGCSRPRSRTIDICRNIGVPQS